MNNLCEIVVLSYLLICDILIFKSMITTELNVEQVKGLINDKCIDEDRDICNYLHGAVYYWCKNCKEENGNPKWFAARDFLGGENYSWAGTPLYSLYQKHIDEGDDNDTSIQKAAIDAGILLKKVISEDKRLFDTEVFGLVRHYRWDGDASY